MYEPLTERRPEQPISYADIMNAIEAIRGAKPQSNRKYFYTSGCGLPDEVCIDYWKGSGVVVVDRKGQQWLNGEKFEEQA